MTLDEYRIRRSALLDYLSSKYVGAWDWEGACLSLRDLRREFYGSCRNYRRRKAA